MIWNQENDLQFKVKGPCLPVEDMYYPEEFHTERKQRKRIGIEGPPDSLLRTGGEFGRNLRVLMTPRQIHGIFHSRRKSKVRDNDHASG
jgi:hypothetical protein